MHLELAELARQAETAASILVPYLDDRTPMLSRDTSSEIPGHEWTGGLGPEFRRAVSDACALTEETERRLIALEKGLKNFDGYVRDWQLSYGAVDGRLSALVQPELDNLDYTAAIILQKRAKRSIHLAHSLLVGSARYFRETTVPGSLIDLPEDIHPPRYGRLKEGVLARIVSADLAVQIIACRDLEASLASAKETTWLLLAGWLGGVKDILDGLTDDIGLKYIQLISGVVACTNPVIDDRDALARAYVALALAYCKELQDRMPDYAEASGQRPPESQVSMNISGGAFYGGQFAGQITNIDSTIAGVSQSGDSQVASALQALEQAVLAQRELDAEQRKDLLDNIEYLAHAAQSPPEKRNRGIIKSALSALTAAAATSTELSKAVDAWGSILHRLVS